MELLKEIQHSLEEGCDEEHRQLWTRNIKDFAVEVVKNSSTAHSLVAADHDALPSSDHEENRNLNQQEANVISLVHRELISALRRPATSRAAVYKIFMTMWVEREADRAAGQRTGFPADILRLEAQEYALQFATYLTRKSKTVISKGKQSSLFGTLRERDVFFNDDDLTQAARKAAPLKVSPDGSTLTFIHKTLQEYCTSVGVLRAITDAVQVTMVPPSEHINMANKLNAEGQASEAETRLYTAVITELLESLAKLAPILASS